MSLLSASVSITRYKVEGKLGTPVLETAAAVLKKNAISEIDDQASEKVSGWTSFEKPYLPDFSGSNFVFGSYLVFALRIDKKTIPAKLIQKHFMIESARRLADSGRQYLSRNEKQTLKDQVVEALMQAEPELKLEWDEEAAGPSARAIGPDGYFRTKPHVNASDAFFGARLVKP